MKALTICQKYAHLVAIGEKPIENRTWTTPYRGPLLIHAGRSRSWLDEDDLTRYPDMAFGAIVAVASLANCVRLAQLPRDLAAHEHANGPWCWILRDVQRLATPIACRGAQGLWTPDPQIVAQVTAQLGRVA